MTAVPHGYQPVAQVRCDACGSIDVVFMPVRSLMDRLRWSMRFAPFKCRFCRKKLYRRVKKKSDP